MSSWLCCGKDDDDQKGSDTTLPTESDAGDSDMTSDVSHHGRRHHRSSGRSRPSHGRRSRPNDHGYRDELPTSRRRRMTRVDSYDGASTATEDFTTTRSSRPPRQHDRPGNIASRRTPAKHPRTVDRDNVTAARTSQKKTPQIDTGGQVKSEKQAAGEAKNEKPDSADSSKISGTKKKKVPTATLR